jgi:hypothetical protein
MNLARTTTLRSNVEILTHDAAGTLVVQGWVFDTDEKRTEIVVLVFYDDQFIATIVPQTARPDVLAAFNAAGADLSPGFAQRITVACRKGAPLALLSVTQDHRYAPLKLPAGPTECDR